MILWIILGISICYILHLRETNKKLTSHIINLEDACSATYKQFNTMYKFYIQAINEIRNLELKLRDEKDLTQSIHSYLNELSKQVNAD